MKIVINRCFGGFDLSDQCYEALGGIRREITSVLYFYILPESIDPKSDIDKRSLRTNSKLIELMETKGSAWCSGNLAELKIVEIPDNVDWIITDYDGVEQIEEVHRIWN